MTTNQEIHPIGKQDKVTRYGWTAKDAPGKFQIIKKDHLQIHPAYQREATNSRILAIASSWSWVACGVIIIGKRGGEYWVIDGQHRVLAAKRRSDIQEMPCLVFDTIDTAQEATGFLNVNTGRMPMSTIAKFRAMLVSGDETAEYVDKVFTKYGVEPNKNSNSPMQIKSVGWALKAANQNKAAFEQILELMSVMCVNSPLKERVLDGLFYLHNNGNPITEKKLRARIVSIGVVELETAANKATAFYSRGGAKVWATGMLIEINKGLQERYKWTLSTE